MSATARAVITDAEGRILILRRSQTDPRYPGKWDLPGGRRDMGETIEQTAVRETFEETGIQLKKPRLLFGTSDVRNGKIKTWLFFEGTVSSGIPITLSYEHDEYKWIKPEELPAFTPYEILLRLHAYITQTA